ncbi:MAG: metallophosphoesterase [Actinomycetota bacterium]|nr:metallophosphoesterase [Actinomycetota bacterium]
MRVQSASKKTMTIIFILAASFLLAALLLPGCGEKDTSAAAEDKASEEVFPKIQEIIYPTMGYPQIVQAGEEFTLEYDFTQDDPEVSQPSSAENWKVSIRSSNDYAPYTADLEVTGTEQGASLRWPEDSGRDVYDVYLVSVAVPGDIHPDLYDLEVSVKADGDEVTDSQPNALAVVEEIKDEYAVLQFTDIHVYDVESMTSCMHDRELHDAVYLRKAIEQINIIDPDIVVFSGDLIFGQRYMPDDWPPGDERGGSTEYEYEYLWAYEAMTELDIPCFYVIGNHDGYYDTVKDGYEWWTESFGPLFYSFDYGNDHYTIFNTMDWSQEDRLLDKGQFYSFSQILEPAKWQGQAQSGGGEFGAAETPPADSYTGQLAWIRDDLADAQEAGLRIGFCHHDPAQVISWDDVDYMGYMIGGQGEGRLALQALCADYRVDMLLSGHEHHDLVTVMPWSDGQGSTVYANTTCIEPKCGITEEYSGYRILEISDGEVLSYNYKEPKWSYPYYDGIVVGEVNDLDPLFDPAIAVEFSNGGDWSTAEDSVTCTVANRLEKDFSGARLEFYMPAAGEGGYQVTGADDFQVVQLPDQPDWEMVRVYFDLPALSVTEITVGK